MAIIDILVEQFKDYWILIDSTDNLTCVRGIIFITISEFENNHYAIRYHIDK